jgi:hypothetical protein
VDAQPAPPSLPPHAGLAALPALEQLLAAHNRLGGALPAEWRAPVLARVDLQHNSFAGGVGWGCEGDGVGLIGEQCLFAEFVEGLGGGGGGVKVCL